MLDIWQLVSNETPIGCQCHCAVGVSVMLGSCLLIYYLMEYIQAAFSSLAEKNTLRQVAGILWLC